MTKNKGPLDFHVKRKPSKKAPKIEGEDREKVIKELVSIVKRNKKLVKEQEDESRTSKRCYSFK